MNYNCRRRVVWLEKPLTKAACGKLSAVQNLPMTKGRVTRTGGAKCVHVFVRLIRSRSRRWSLGVLTCPGLGVFTCNRTNRSTDRPKTTVRFDGAVVTPLDRMRRWYTRTRNSKSLLEEGGGDRREGARQWLGTSDFGSRSEMFHHVLNEKTMLCLNHLYLHLSKMSHVLRISKIKFHFISFYHQIQINNDGIPGRLLNLHHRTR